MVKQPLVKRLFQSLRPLVSLCLVVGLAAVLFFSQADSALAARAGGRVGGGSFRAPRYSAPPTRTYSNPRGGGYYPGGGFGFPFLIPIFGFGGGFGGLFGLLMLIAVANFVVRAVRSAGQGDGYDAPSVSSNPPVAVAKLQVGLLAEARSLQDDLNRIGATADTGTSAGLAQLLQETTLSLLRHPDYWAYANASSEQTRLLSAEQTFNRLSLAERSKFTEESLSNVNRQLRQAEDGATLAKAEASTAPGEYILATLLVATQGKIDLPTVRSTDDLRRALSQVGAVGADRLLAVEVLWTPQRSGETLTGDEMVAEYPDLVLL